MSTLLAFLLATAAGLSILAFMAGIAMVAVISVRTLGGGW